MATTGGYALVTLVFSTRILGGLSLVQSNCVNPNLGAGTLGVLQAKGQGRAIQQFRWHRAPNDFKHVRTFCIVKCGAPWPKIPKRKGKGQRCQRNWVISQWNLCGLCGSLNHSHCMDFRQLNASYVSSVLLCTMINMIQYVQFFLISAPWLSQEQVRALSALQGSHQMWVG